MAIGFPQSIGFSNGATNGITSTLTGVAGGSLLVTTQGVFISGGAPNVTPTDDKSNAWNTTVAPTVRDNTVCYINYAMNVASGDTIVTLDYGTNFAIDGEFSEVSGIVPTNALDEQQ